MQIISFIIVWIILIKKLLKYESPYKRAAKRDLDASNNVKSNMWYRQHGKK